ncbi:MAG: hypothetical protein IKF99_12145 [Oscillospiraceae bacterium]|nr:hypothetical protein [Oscillospiraceae bacterium]
MKHTEIEAIMTAKVNEFITKGYTINATTMSGSQGEIAKIDFRKGDEVYRVLLEQTTEYNDHGTRDVAILTVGRSTENVIRDDRPFDSMGPTFWNNRMEIIEQRKFYQVDRRSDYYIEDVEEYDEMVQKRYERYRNHDDYRPRKELPEAARMIAKQFIKRTTGKARVNSKEIKVYKGARYRGENIHYYAEYRGKTYKIG